MNPALLIKLHPAGPWRFGPSEGGREAIDHLYRSDRFFSAVTIAFERLGLLSEWLDATVKAEKPEVCFSSLFPFQGETLFATPPATIWPPPATAVRVSSPVFSTKVRWRDARFTPISLIETLLMSQRVLADQWTTDPESACLLRRDRPQSSPYRAATRTQVAVDRLSGNHETHSLACVEFEAGSGLWAVASFADEAAVAAWKERLRGVIRLLADTGFGGKRSSGWGQVSKVDLREGVWPTLLFPKLAKAQTVALDGNQEHWLLSLFSPASSDKVDWAQGNYSLAARGGYVESARGTGSGKKLVRMIAEGSVIAATGTPKGTALDVAPESAAHPSYRCGFALSVTLPVIDYSLAEEPTAEAVELHEALTEALRTAAEEDARNIAEETAEEAAEEFGEVEQELKAEAPDTAAEPEEEEKSAEDITGHEI